MSEYFQIKDDIWILLFWHYARMSAPYIVTKKLAEKIEIDIDYDKVLYTFQICKNSSAPILHSFCVYYMLKNYRKCVHCTFFYII